MKDYEDLRFTDDFMFCKILQENEDLCKEVDNLVLKDGTERVFICAGGDRDDVSEDMKHFIDYIVGDEAGSDLTSRIDDKVREAIEKRLWRKEYMTYKEQMDQEFKKGLEQGIKIFIEDKIEDGVSEDDILRKLEKRFILTPEKAKEYYDKFSE